VPDWVTLSVSEAVPATAGALVKVIPSVVGLANVPVPSAHVESGSLKTDTGLAGNVVSVSEP
jgi:hypothetical protein